MSEYVSRYDKIELSDPLFEQANLRFMTFNSPALGGRGDVTLYIPSVAEGITDLPLVLLLHGVFCSHWAWALKGGAHTAAAELIDRGEIPPLVLAMPSDGLWAEGSGYLPHNTADYDQWIVEDVVGCVQEAIPQVGERSPLFIAGLSMGGYGALRLGAKYAPRFQGISGHSSLTRIERLRELVSPRRIQIRSDQARESSILYWLEENREQLPPMRFDCGVDDHLIAANRELHQQLTEMSIAHQYEEFPGEHTWPYWQEHIYDTLRFFAEICRSD